MCMLSICGSRKRVSDLLELQLQMVVNLHVGAGNRTQVFWKSSHVSSPWWFILCSYTLIL